MARKLIGRTLLMALIALPATTQSVGPGPRHGHELVYDAGRGVTLLFGGFGPDGIPKGDTWLWSGTAWRRVSGAGPSARKWAAATYDSRRQRIVLHGGRTGEGQSGPSLGDTWVWDGSRWSRVATDGPSGRDHHRLAYDAVRDRVVLFGGWDGQKVVGDTWEWDGTEWVLIAAEGPSPRAPVGLAYHEEKGTVVLAGGQDLDRAYGDVWSWDGLEWRLLDADLPSARGFHAMAYVPDSKELLLFGGRDGDRLFNELLTWDGAKWQLVSSDGPVRRGIYASAYDARRGELLIHGSGTLGDDGWALDSRTWVWRRGAGWSAVAGGDD